MESFLGHGKEPGFYFQWEPLRGFSRRVKGSLWLPCGDQSPGSEAQKMPGNDPGERGQCLIWGGILEVEPTKKVC